MTNKTTKTLSVFELFKLPLFCVLGFCIFYAFLGYVPLRDELFSGNMHYGVYERIIDFIVFNWRNFADLILFVLLLVIVFAKNSFIGFTRKNIMICVLISFLFTAFSFYLIGFLIHEMINAGVMSTLILKSCYLTLQIVLMISLAYFGFLSKRTDYVIDGATAYKITILIYSLLMAVIILKIMQVMIPIKYTTITYSDAQRIAENIRQYKIDAFWVAVFAANFIFVYGWAKQVLHKNMFENNLPLKKIIVSSFISIIFAAITAALLYLSIIYIIQSAGILLRTPIYIWYLYSFVFFVSFIISFVMLLKQSPLYLKVVIATAFFIAFIFAFLIFYRTVFVNFDKRVCVVLSFMLFYSALSLYLTSLCCLLPIKKVFKI
jgi:hypothetical protein